MTGRKFSWSETGAALLLCCGLAAAQEQVVWQYSVPVAEAPKPARAYLWIPPACERVRGLLVGGMTLIEKDLVEDPLIRRACAEEGLAIVFLYPACDLTFNYKEKAADKILLRLLSDLADLSGCAEIAEAPLLPVGHSTGGLFARNVAYWNPARTIAVVHIKSGPIAPPPFDPAATIKGVPLLAINGQFEEFGPYPSGNIPKGKSQEGQWMTVRESVLRLRAGGVPANLIVEPGAGHFAWSEPLAHYVALFIRKAARFRLPEGGAALKDAGEGWLSDGGITIMIHAPAPPAKYAGDPATAFWNFDEELARANDAFHRGRFSGEDQFVTFVQDGRPVEPVPRPALRFEPAGDGTSFKVKGTFLEAYPGHHPRAGEPVGHAEGPVRFRVVRGSAIQTGPDTFRIRWDAHGINPSTARVIVMAYHAGDGRYRHAEQPVNVRIPERNTKGKAQAITFPDIPSVTPDAGPFELEARSDSGLEVSYYVAYGPAVVEGNRLRIAEVPRRARFPLKVSVVAVQWGRPLEPLVQSAEPVERIFLVERR